MADSTVLEAVLSTEALLRKLPHVVAGVAIAFLWLWVSELPWFIKRLNPHRSELEAILSKEEKVTQAEAQIARGAMMYGATIKSAVILAVAILICWA